MSHPDVSLVNILLSITRVSLVQNNCVFCQLRVHLLFLLYDLPFDVTITRTSRKAVRTLLCILLT